MLDHNGLIYTVSDVNKYIKIVLSNDENLKFLHVRGEISNLKVAATGHVYFSLKDENSLINAVFFSTYASRLSFVPKNGDEVTVLASVDVYQPRGTYQLMVYEMNPVGKGNQLLELEALKKKLQAEGLFAEERKRPISLYPEAIGIITAPNGAAVHDLVINIRRRYPIADIYVFPSAVQGENAPKELLKAFLTAQNYPLTTLIIGRGGGASEDLSAFNDEALVRAISQSKMPVISAVGHEVDVTLTDYVADKRASTPTGAAELATIDRREIEQRLQYANEDLKTILKERVSDIIEEVEDQKSRMQDILKNKLLLIEEKVEGIAKFLSASNPTAILEKGYSITFDQEGKVVHSAKKVREGDILLTKLEDGNVHSKVVK